MALRKQRPRQDVRPAVIQAVPHTNLMSALVLGAWPDCGGLLLRRSKKKERGKKTLSIDLSRKAMFLKGMCGLTNALILPRLMPVSVFDSLEYARKQWVSSSAIFLLIRFGNGGYTECPLTVMLWTACLSPLELSSDTRKCFQHCDSACSRSWGAKYNSLQIRRVDVRRWRKHFVVIKSN